MKRISNDIGGGTNNLTRTAASLPLTRNVALSGYRYGYLTQIEYDGHGRLNQSQGQ